MATTTVTFLRDYPAALTAKLTSVGGTGTPNASGYACTNTNGLQSLTITEALVGEFYLYAYDSLGDIAFQSYVTLADDTGVYRASDLSGRWQDEGGAFFDFTSRDKPS